MDYYKVLEIDPKATDQQIRDAYKKAALKHHPDRVPSDSPERATRTKKFQQINDAYYTLSDSTRRHDYDEARRYTNFGSASPPSSSSDEEPEPQSRGWNFPWTSTPNPSSSRDQFAHEQFGGIFEEMLREEGMAEGQHATPTGKFWSMVGGVSGGAMGFIVANLPGMVAGAVAGNRLGAVRDAKGKSVYQVFSDLPQGDKARLLSELAAKVFAHAVGGS